MVEPGVSTPTTFSAGKKPRSTEATPAEVPANAQAITPTPAPQPAETMTQEQQIEAIRRRIEARRAQMRAEAARTADDKR